MILHIIQREFLDHLNSLRFALTAFILGALMVINAVWHLQTHPDRVRTYSENVTTSRNELKSRTQLYRLLEGGPGELYKRPSVLSFVADGGDAFLPGHISDTGGSWSKSVGGTTLKSIWWLEYPSVNPNSRNLRPKATMIDWAFIITYLLSFIPLLFTFDALSGEKESGTLRLCLANPISRPALLIGKFLGTLITVLLPFYFAVLLNLAMISADSWTQFGTGDWGRLGMIVLIASGYVSIFIAIGLMVSAGTRESRVSLVVLLLIWVSLVVFVPSTLGTLATKWMPYVQSVDQFNTAKQIALEPIDTDYVNRLQAYKEQRNKQSNVSSKLTQLLKTSPENFEELRRLEYEDDKELFLKAERVNKEVDIRERLNREYLTAQIEQVQSARAITRLSPAAIVQYALESMAGTGLNRHLQFLEGVHRHIRQFRTFIVDMDKADTESLHLIGIPEGMSKNPISPRAIPTYEDKITFRETFNAAMVDMLLLVFLLCMFIFGAFLVFIHSEV